MYKAMLSLLKKSTNLQTKLQADLKLQKKKSVPKYTWRNYFIMFSLTA